MKIPIIIVNFKTYRSATGAKALKLAKICEKVAKKTKINIAVAVQVGDIYRITSQTTLPVIAEHMDYWVEAL